MNGDADIPDRDDDQLVQRLRTLEWPGVDPQLKHQCWLEFQERLRREEPRRTLMEGDRLEFTGRRTPMRGLVPAARLGVAGGWLRARALSGLTPSY
ncbi:MAG TPA: hypothetical protein VGW10_03360 [Solirubrobacteraceae bacterium]|nr:hypothetical protein [Solirubrobacteraceae bacterium]